MAMKLVVRFAFLVFLFSVSPTSVSADGYANDVPEVLRGPYISGRDIVTALDCDNHRAAQSCKRNFGFQTILKEKIRDAVSSDGKKAVDAALMTNAGFLPKNVREILKADIIRITTERVKNKPSLVDRRFPIELLDPPADNAAGAGASMELVGIVNRMDRQFILDTSASDGKKLQAVCGELSLIYRLAYRRGKAMSRLPMTANLVFPILSHEAQIAGVNCPQLAKRWLSWVERWQSSDAGNDIDFLLDRKHGPLAFLHGSDLERLEFNIQVYRLPAGEIEDWGTEAKYLMRVFRWLGKGKTDGRPVNKFIEGVLPNQIVRCLNFPEANGKNEPVHEKTGCVPFDKELRKKLVSHLQTPKVARDVDYGTLNIPQIFEDKSNKKKGKSVLAKAAVSVSPGGSHRSLNQPYWRSALKDEQVITDDEILIAMEAALGGGHKFNFIKNVDDFRTRLNESTCTGCHQTRAIAGFHFPGEDRDGTPIVNSVLLAGSPHFYGDQARRTDILRKIAESEDPSGKIGNRERATSYASRPQNSFKYADAEKTIDRLNATELIGGWGSSCLMDEYWRPDARQESPKSIASQRQWDCKLGYRCRQVYKSDNDPGIGICLPEGMAKIGDAVQFGRVQSSAYGDDCYCRDKPNGYCTKPCLAYDGREEDEKGALMLELPAAAPAANQNSYYGAHQEWYRGLGENLATKDGKRNFNTGGFPAGMFRLSECIGLPAEATCGLTASTGFNRCLTVIGKDSAPLVNGQPPSIVDCLEQFTSFAGMRACDAASPCRDDYICVKPILEKCDSKIDFATRVQKLAETRKKLMDRNFFDAIHVTPYSPAGDYGQLKPDTSWERNESKGFCIPPYFVFQFRSDNHPTSWSSVR